MYTGSKHSFFPLLQCTRTRNKLSQYQINDLLGFEPKSTRPKTHPNETPIRIKERIIEFRQKQNKCTLKLQIDLLSVGINFKTRTIGKIIKKEGLTRKYRTRKLKYKYI